MKLTVIGRLAEFGSRFVVPLVASCGSPALGREAAQGSRGRATVADRLKRTYLTLRRETEVGRYEGQPADGANLSELVWSCRGGHPSGADMRTRIKLDYRTGVRCQRRSGGW